MTPAFGVYLFAMSVLASAMGGTLGMAGGIFVVPMLTASGVGIRTAVGASIVSVIACSCGSASPFLRRRLTNTRLAIVLELATTLGALTGVLLADRLPTSALYVLFAGILLLSAQQMMARRGEEGGAGAGASESKGAGASAGAGESESVGLGASGGGWGDAFGLHASYPDPATGVEIPYTVRRVPLAMSLMYGAGLVSALLGIGSGVLKIPAMDTALRLPLKVSSATSNFMIGVTAAASAGAYFVRGDIVPAIAGPVVLGSVVGAILGARILVAVPSARLRAAFVVVLLLLAAQMSLEGFGVHLFGGHT
ncbi:MAG TPA: sulfite exporter TauE/SafE family protein [Polyangiaceae bacterium]